MCLLHVRVLRVCAWLRVRVRVLRVHVRVLRVHVLRVRVLRVRVHVCVRVLSVHAVVCARDACHLCMLQCLAVSCNELQ